VADKMPAQLTMNEKKERVSKLLELDAKLSREYRESKLGDTDNIIVEEIKTVNGENYYVGHTPEYVMVALKEDEALNKNIGRTVKVKLVKMLTDEVVLGEKI
jgi:threonylcarbamoyladenosine tRNA methylthiotransferase MtaB